MEFRFLRIKRQNMKFSSPITAFSGSIEIAILFRFCPTLYLFGTQSFRGKAIAFCKFRSSDLNESDGTRPARFFLSDMEHIRSFGKKQSLRISLFKWREFYIQNALVLYHKLLSPTYDTFRTKGARINQNQIDVLSFLNGLSFFHPLSCLITVHRHLLPFLHQFG